MTRANSPRIDFLHLLQELENSRRAVHRTLRQLKNAIKVSRTLIQRSLQLSKTYALATFSPREKAWDAQAFAQRLLDGRIDGSLNQHLDALSLEQLHQLARALHQKRRKHLGSAKPRTTGTPRPLHLS